MGQRCVRVHWDRAGTGAEEGQVYQTRCGASKGQDCDIPVFERTRIKDKLGKCGISLGETKQRPVFQHIPGVRIGFNQHVVADKKQF